MKFYLCRTCGNLVETIDDGGNIPICCNKLMEELTPEKSDGSLEKHVPVCTLDTIRTDTDSTSNVKAVHVKVGSEPHPMEKHHSIKWIVLETNCGIYRHMLDKCEKAEACTTFYISEQEELVNIYEYCNVHGLYVAEIKAK